MKYSGLENKIEFISLLNKKTFEIIYEYKKIPENFTPKLNKIINYVKDKNLKKDELLPFKLKDDDLIIYLNKYCYILMLYDKDKIEFSIVANLINNINNLINKLYTDSFDKNLKLMIEVKIDNLLNNTNSNYFSTISFLKYYKNEAKDELKKNNNKKIIIIIVSGVIFLLFCAFLILYYYYIINDN